MKNNATALRALMRKHKLKNADIAVIAQVHLKTVESWLASPGSANGRKMADRHLTLIKQSLRDYLGVKP